jgi:hypothetical protein
MGVKINYGLCHGGPYNKKNLADHREVFPVAIDKTMRRASPGMVASADPNVVFGAYHFADGVWTWRE